MERHRPQHLGEKAYPRARRLARRALDSVLDTAAGAYSTMQRRLDYLSQVPASPDPAGPPKQSSALRLIPPEAEPRPQEDLVLFVRNLQAEKQARSEKKDPAPPEKVKHLPEHRGVDVLYLTAPEDMVREIFRRRN